MAERTGLEVAVVGMSGRFPLAANVQEYWDNLCHGVEAITLFSAEEIVAAGIDPALVGRPNYVKAAAALDDIAHFDAAFFGYSPREAETMDPQQRIFLEAAWHALEHAGYAPESSPVAIGVYAGAGLSNYLLRAFAHNPQSQFLALIGNDKDFLTTRVSYKLNLTGPSIDVQTACSTSLVAVHLACQGLLSGECDMALAGGIAVKVPQKVGYLYEEGGILSPDGHCRAFDARSQGTVVGNGVGIVVLKRLEDAETDGDTIWAVIKGTAINNDGARKIGYTAPSVEGQAAVIQAAQHMAEVDPTTIGYIEAHGTGTVLGDPIEIAALTQVFRTHTDATQFCAIGSVKTNIGHLDAAAGIAGLIKAILALHHQVIPSSLYFEQPNPQIGFEHTPFYVNTSLQPWPDELGQRRAGVSSFGIGGTNAHVILEEAPSLHPSGPSRPWQLLLLSAQTAEALESLTAALADHIRNYPEVELADVAYTLKTGRTLMHHRRAFVCRDRAEALDLLVAQMSGQGSAAVLTTIQQQKERPVIFLFPGQGAQYVDMGRDLYETERVFRDSVDRCAQILLPHLGFDLRMTLYPAAGQETTTQLQQTSVTQPALFVVEYALAQLWLSWGIVPQAMIGHSVGEYVAACLAGVFSLEDGLALIAFRGQLMQALPSGSMLSIPLSTAEVSSRLPATLSLAAINAPDACVVSGPTAAVEAIAAAFQVDGIKAQVLHTSHAFHSAMMDPILVPFTKRVEKMVLRPPTIPYISNVTGTWIRVEEATTPAYWAEHLRGTVRFSAGVETLLTDETPLLLEVGPGHTLTTLVRRHPQKAPAQVVLASMRQSRDRQSDIAFLLKSLARLWLNGVKIDWRAFTVGEVRRRVPLPLYPFAQSRYWLDGAALPGPSTPERAATDQDDLKVKRPLGDWFYRPQWQPTTLPVLAGESKPTTWLLFASSNSLSEEIIKQLRDEGHQVIVVKAGAQFASLDDSTYMLNPEAPADYDKLLVTLELMQSPTRFVHLWLADNAPRPFTAWQQRGFNSLLFLAQAWERQRGGMVQIDLITSQASDVSGNELLEPAKMTSLAPLRVLPQEYGNMRCRHIDVALPGGEGEAIHLRQQLSRELSSPVGETEVAYRGQQRWVQTFLPFPSGEGEKPTLLRPHGVYLFTSGLTVASQILANYLACSVQARLIFLNHPNSNGDGTQEERATQLEAAGASVAFYTADVGDTEQMTGVIEQVCSRFGALHGVLHTAGATMPSAFTTVQETEETALAQHFHPKIEGARTLQQVLASVPLDFCLFHSSLASILGGIRFLGQAAADLYLDSAAHLLARERPGRWFSINWDAWSLPGQEGPGDSTLAITAEEVPAVFARLLTLPVSGQVAVSTHSLPGRLARWRAGTTVEQTTGCAGHARPDHLPTAYVAPRNELEGAIVNIWEIALGISPVGVHDNFFELGGHSLLLTQVMARVREQFPVELPLNQLFAVQTVADLTLAIVQGLAEEEEGNVVLEMLDEIESISTLEPCSLG